MSAGNQYQDSSLTKTLSVLKANILQSLNVCKLAKIESISNGAYTCKDLNDEQKIIISTNLKQVSQEDLIVGAIVCILCADNDYRSNLKQLKFNLPFIKKETKTFHSINYGIIIGTI